DRQGGGRPAGKGDERSGQGLLDGAQGGSCRLQDQVRHEREQVERVRQVRLGQGQALRALNASSETTVRELAALTVSVSPLFFRETLGPANSRSAQSAPRSLSVRRANPRRSPPSRRPAGWRPGGAPSREAPRFRPARSPPQSA